MPSTGVLVQQRVVYTNRLTLIWKAGDVVGVELHSEVSVRKEDGVQVMDKSYD